jgi:hypothetical protein
MRRKARVLLMVATCVIPTACITGFKHPLGSVEDAFVEPNLIGNWACSAADDPTPSVLKIMDFDGKQYYIESPGDQGNASHSRALATRIEDVTFLSVRELGTKDEDWTFLEYALSDADHLSLRVVDTTPFEDVIDDAPSVKQRLAEQMQDPEIVVSLLSCTRVKPQG